MNVPFGQQNISFPGYGLFWVANSISSTLLGFSNRHVQEQAAERNLEFMHEMEEARQVTEDVKIQEEIAFKRRLMAVARQYRQQESSKAFSIRMKGKELKSFLDKSWPLDISLPWNIIEEIEAGQNTKCLNVILMHSPLLPMKKYGGVNDNDEAIYKNLEYRIKTEDVPCMGFGDINFRKDACVKTDFSGGNANIMNIHFLMNQLPTLVISPRYHEGRLMFNGAVWEPQAARPLIRPLISFDYEPRIIEKDEKERERVIDLFHTTVSIIIGSVRDSYMLLTQGKEPTLGKWLNDGKHEYMKSVILRTPQLMEFIKKENNNILAALSLEQSPKLLEAYNEVDIQKMRDLINAINI